MSSRGFLLALMIIAVPVGLAGIYLSRASENSRVDGRVAGGCAGMIAVTAWGFGGPLVADWRTPDFYIGGWWQYVVLMALDLAVSVFVAAFVYRTHYLEQWRRWRDRHRSADTS